MDSQKKIAAAATRPPQQGTAGILKPAKSNATASPRKSDQSKNELGQRPMSAGKEQKKVLVHTTNSADEEEGNVQAAPIKVTRAADGRFGSRGGGDSLLRLPLECMSKKEIKAELRSGEILLPAYGYLNDDDDNNEEEEEEEDGEMNTMIGPDKARFNVWKGKNYDLHLLGDFKSDFDKRVRSFHRPGMEEILMDPFCRSESGLVEEPPTGKAFLVWKSKSDRWDPKKAMAETETGSHYPVLVTSSSSSSGDDDNDQQDSDTDSLPDPEMKEYIQAQRKIREEGKNVTGETIYYDDEFDVLRNLHKESYSLTNYGGNPDDIWIGKAHLFYPEMTDEEKKMLQAKPEVGKSISKKKSSTTISIRTPRKKQQNDKSNRDEQSLLKPETFDASAGDCAATSLQ